MDIAFAILSMLLKFISGAWYAWDAYKGRSSPACATWIILAGMVYLSYATYQSSPDPDLIRGVGNGADVVGITLVLFGLASQRRPGAWTLRPIDWCCLFCATAILFAWAFTNASTESNLYLQIVMAIAYVPTISKLWVASRNTETWSPWLLAWGGVATGLVPALHPSFDLLAFVYGGRGLTLCTFVLLLMLSHEIRARRRPRSL